MKPFIAVGFSRGFFFFPIIQKSITKIKQNGLLDAPTGSDTLSEWALHLKTLVRFRVENRFLGGRKENKHTSSLRSDRRSQ